MWSVVGALRNHVKMVVIRHSITHNIVQILRAYILISQLHIVVRRAMLEQQLHVNTDV